MEKLIIRGRGDAADHEDDLVTEDVEGHRAPVIELLSRTTQTPIESYLADSLPNDPLPIMFEVSEITALDRSESRTSERSHSVSTTDGSDERCSSVSPSFIPGRNAITCAHSSADLCVLLIQLSHILLVFTQCCCISSKLHTLRYVHT